MIKYKIWLCIVKLHADLKPDHKNVLHLHTDRREDAIMTT